MALLLVTSDLSLLHVGVHWLFYSLRSWSRIIDSSGFAKNRIVFLYIWSYTKHQSKMNFSPKLTGLKYIFYVLFFRIDNILLCYHHFASTIALHIAFSRISRRSRTHWLSTSHAPAFSHRYFVQEKIISVIVYGHNRFQIIPSRSSLSYIRTKAQLHEHRVSQRCTYM